MNKKKDETGEMFVPTNYYEKYALYLVNNFQNIIFGTYSQIGVAYAFMRTRIDAFMRRQYKNMRRQYKKSDKSD